MLYNVPLRHLFPNISLYSSDGEMSSESRLAGRMPCAHRLRPQRTPPALSHPTPAPPHALAEHRPHIRTTRPPRHAYPSLTLLRSLIYPPFLSPSPCTAAHPPQGSPASTTPLACRASRAHSRAVRRRTLAAPSLRLLARRSPCPALTAHRTVRNRSSPRRNIETADSQFLSKAFQTLWSAY